MGCVLHLIRLPIAILAGAIVTAILVTAGLAVTLSALGVGGCFAGPAWTVSDNFGSISLAIVLVASVAGGFAARSISGFSVGLLVLILIFLSLMSWGEIPFGQAASSQFADRPDPRPDQLGVFDLMRWCERPSWLRWALTLAALVGILIGGSLGKPRSSKPQRSRAAK